MRIAVHIGAGKCGSSSIQSFLRLNCRALLQQGFIVPTCTLTEDGMLTGHHVSYFETMRRAAKLSAASDEFATALKQIESGAPEHAHTILLSAENLSHPLPWPKLFAAVRLAGELSVLAYIRRQDDFLESAWQQWFCKVHEDLHDWLEHRLGKFGDWRATLAPWIEIAGRDAIAVRRFSRADLTDGDVVKDYAAAIGIDCTGLTIPVEENFTLNVGFTRLLERLRPAQSGGSDNRLNVLVRRVTGERHRHRAEERLLSGAERIRVLARFQESNDWVRDNFFPELVRLGEPLFRELTREEALAEAVSADVAEQQMWAIIGDLVLNGEVSPRTVQE